MSKILSNIEIDDYGLQSMKSEGGGGGQAVLTPLSVTPSTSSQNIRPEQGVDGFSQVSVSAIETESKTVKSTTTQQTVTPTSGKFIDEIVVQPLNLQSKSVTITENGTNIITVDNNYDGLGQVTVTTDVSGGTLDPDWTEIGYSNAPQSVLDAFYYAQEIYYEWDDTETNLIAKFSGDKSLIYMPLVNTSNATNMQSMFVNCSNLKEVPLLNTENVTTMYHLFESCSALKEVPLLNTKNVTTMANMFKGCSSLEYVPQFDTRSNKSIGSMFADCTSLQDVPVFDTTKVTYMGNAFQNCNVLSTESLNNIMKMCINATDYQQGKTLAVLGINQAQATSCQWLSNYQDFLAAGWTTGY